MPISMPIAAAAALLVIGSAAMGAETKPPAEQPSGVTGKTGEGPPGTPVSPSKQPSAGVTGKTGRGPSGTPVSPSK